MDLDKELVLVAKQKTVVEMEQKKETTRTMSEEAKERISERLSRLENLYFPRALESTVSLPSQRKSIFHDLLSRDVALFLGLLRLTSHFVTFLRSIHICVSRFFLAVIKS